MQQVMDMMWGLQDEMAESRAEQERMQADLAASHVRNDELHRINKELRRGLGDNQGQRDQNETEPLTPPREFSTPFSQEILEAVILMEEGPSSPHDESQASKTRRSSL